MPKDAIPRPQCHSSANRRIGKYRANDMLTEAKGMEQFVNQNVEDQPLPLGVVLHVSRINPDMACPQCKGIGVVA